MAKRVRTIINIDEALCNGCGLCISPCAESALELVDGKARVIRMNCVTAPVFVWGSVLRHFLCSREKQLSFRKNTVEDKKSLPQLNISRSLVVSARCPKDSYLIAVKFQGEGF